MKSGVSKRVSNIRALDRLGDEQSPAGTQDARHFSQGGAARFALEVMQRKARDGSVHTGVR